MTFDLNWSEDQRQICDAAASMLATHYPVGRLRNSRHDDLSSIAEFGGFTLAFPEEQGGTGFTPVEEALLHVLLGRHLISTRALATALALRLAHHVSLSNIAESPVCVAVPNEHSILFIEPEKARLALIFTGRSLKLATLDGLAFEPVKGLGDGVPLGSAHAGDVSILHETHAPEIMALVDLLVSAQLLGIAEGARDLAVSYARIRHQFGKPIGAFQAIKHHCATMAVETEMLSSLLDMAAIALAGKHADAEFQLAALRRLAPKVALANARTSIQIHGGIGFSDEADAHHFLKQAHILSRLGSGAAILDLPAPLAPHRKNEEA